MAEPAKPTGLRVIIHATEDPDDLILGARSAKWLINHPDRKDVLLTYGDDHRNTWWVVRNKSTITARRSYVLRQ